MLEPAPRMRRMGFEDMAGGWFLFSLSFVDVCIGKVGMGSLMSCTVVATRVSQPVSNALQCEWSSGFSIHDGDDDDGLSDSGMGLNNREYGRCESSYPYSLHPLVLPWQMPQDRIVALKSY